MAGVDGSEESLRAVEWAAREAQQHRAPLRIVAAPALLPSMRAHPQDPETVTARLQGESCRALDEAITRSREVAPGPLTDADLLTGPPALVVTQSGSGALMLVIIGRHDAAGSRPAIGGIQHALLNHARGPVAIVPATD